MRFGPRELQPREFRIPTEVSSLFDETRTNGYYFAVWSRDDMLLKRSTNAPFDMPIPERLRGDTRTRIRMRVLFRESFQFTELGDCVLAGRNITDDLDALGRFAWWLTAAGSTVLAFGLGVGWWLTTRAIRPVEEISAAASRISAGNLAERISGADADNELGRLVAVLNSTFARLETAFTRQKQFTADASHELRTPLSVIICEAQTALTRDRSASEYRETIQACLDTAQQMRQLTESLLELARFDAGARADQYAILDLAENTRACVERVRPLAAGLGFPIHCDLRDASVSGNADRLSQVITNLLTNAIHYNKPGGTIRVSTRAEHGSAVLTVSDTGLGIAPEDLPHIFERFYRSDKSRSRAEGRSGLGLAICKAILDADGGRIEVSSAHGSGSTFTVWLPATPSQTKAEQEPPG
jgi:heavy metal sensor kinase